MLHRIAIVGPESTGKSILSEQLAKHYNSLFVAEYAREYIEQLQRDYTIEDIETIARMQLKNENELQSYFVKRIEKYLNSKGRNIIGWDEILEGGLAPNATIMSWRGEEGGIEAAKQKHKVIMTPTTYVYFDYSQTKNEDSVVIGGFLPLEKIYGFEPLPKKLTPEFYPHVLGGQGNLWTEYVPNLQQVEYMMFPRLGALAETYWSPKDARDFENFKTRTC